MKRIFIDVREPYEFKHSHVAEAINIPPNKIHKRSDLVKNLPKNAELVVYCISGARSDMAINLLSQMGFKHLVNGINQDQIHAKYGVNID